MKWIKASERLPGLYDVVYLKESLNGHRRMGNFFKEEDGTISFGVMGNGAHEGFTIENKHFEDIEWLDESINQEGSLKDWKEKFREWDEGRCKFEIYRDTETLLDWIEENVIAPLLQKECKGDDLVAEQPVSSKMEHTEIGGSSENGRWVNRREREPEKTGKYKIRYALTDFDDSFEEAEETYYNQSGWNKHGYAQFVMAWWEESNTKEHEEKYYPGIQYQRLFNAISETKGIPTQSDMDEIIRIVHEDFPLWISVNDRLPDCKDKSTAYDGLFSERVLIVEEHQNKQRIDISNCRLDDINVDGFIAYKQQAPTHKWGVQGNNMNVTHWMPLPKCPTELVNPERNASPRTSNQGDEAGSQNPSRLKEATPQMKIAKEALEIHNKEWQDLLKKEKAGATILSAEEVLNNAMIRILNPTEYNDYKNAKDSICTKAILAAMEEYKNQEVNK